MNLSPEQSAKPDGSGLKWIFSENNPDRRRNFLIAVAIVSVLFIFGCIGYFAIRNRTAEVSAPASAATVEAVSSEVPANEAPVAEVPEEIKIPVGVLPVAGADLRISADNNSEIVGKPDQSPLKVLGKDMKDPNIQDDAWIYVEDKNGLKGWIPMKAIVINDPSFFLENIPDMSGSSTIVVVPSEAASESQTQEKISTTSNGWEMIWYPAADFDRGDGTTFRQDAQNWNWPQIAPELWPTFPNEPNPLVPEFRVINTNEVPDGLEFAMSETNFCQQIAGENCSVPVAAEHFLLYTGSYNIPGIGTCVGEDLNGCALAVVDVGKVTGNLLGSFDQGFRIHARYWNGNELDMAIWALMSHTSNVMLDMNSELNPESIQNAGANCSVPEGCKTVHNRIVFISGNEVLLEITTTVSK